MNPSYYNTIVPLPGSDNAVIFNARTSAIGLLDHVELALYRELEESDSPGKRALSFLGELREGGFSMGDAEGEADFMRYQFEKYRFDDAVFELYVAPTMGCNFNCPYCFEHKREGHMGEKVQDALLAFLEEQYESRPYRELKIVWYGGEPLLRMDVIEALSARFIAFCKERGVKYVASMISNTSLADERVQEKLVKCRVWSVMTTIDGVGEVHEARRVNREGSPTYETILSNVEGMTEKGICVDFRCILEKGNVGSCLKLTESMAGHKNLGIRVKPMRDMAKLGREVPEAAQVDPLEPEAYAEAFYQVFLQSNPDADSYARALAPLHLHCSASMDRGYAIDELGNAYNCGCAIGDEKKALFNICEPPETRKVRWDMVAWYGSHNPLDNERCRSCRVLPLCQGGCLRIDEDPYTECNPLRYCIEKMVLGYYQALDADAADARAAG